MAKQPDSPPLAAMVPSALAPPGQSMPGLWLAGVALLLIALGPMGARAQAPAGPPPLAPAGAPAAKPWDAVLIASFNIQVFGESKIAKPQVVNVLTKVVRNFDVVAIQEVRAKSDGIIPQFVKAINADGSRYHYVIGPRLGRTVSKEQYTFIYDTNRIEVDAASIGTVPNPGDRLHRPPLHVRFRTRINPPQMAFTFWLVDIHTDPDEVPQEIDALADVFTSMLTLRPDEDDVILLGDLNAGPPLFGRFKKMPNASWAISNATTNTHRTKTYDNLIFDKTTTREYLGRSGVLDLQSTYGLTLDQALEVSDHNPVWAAFYPCEAQNLPGPQATTGIALAPR